MTLSRKFIFAIIISIIFIAFINITAFYIFYSSYLKIYLVEKNEKQEYITMDNINDAIKKQTVDNIDSAFSDTELQFFELLEQNNYKIPLDKDENKDLVMSYLIRSWIAPKYIKDIIPTDNFTEVLDALKNKNSLEYNFLNRLVYSIIITNIIAIFMIILALLFFTKRTIWPINKITQEIKKSNENFVSWNKNIIKNINYKNKDEVWLLVEAINNLNKKLNLQNKIRTKLLADISHELKTPITSIQCYLEWIIDWVVKLDKKNLDAITKEMVRLINLVNKIMSYEKFESQDIKLQITEFNPFDLLKSLSETHKKRLKEMKQRIKVTWEENIKLKADRDLFIQVSHNLIWNFLKYAGKNTILTINITKRYIDFSDNWVWVKSSEIPFLTEKFYQSNSEKTWNISIRWIWIWLSMITKIIEAHSWKYEIKTEISKWFKFKIFTQKSH